MSLPFLLQSALAVCAAEWWQGGAGSLGKSQKV